MHEYAMKVLELWKKEQVRDALLSEWSGLNGAVKRLKEEHDARTEELAALLAIQAGLKDRERDAARRTERYGKARDKAQKAIDTGTATDFGLALEQVRKCVELLDEVETESLEIMEEQESTDQAVGAVRRVLAQKVQLLAAAEAAREARKTSLKEAFDQATAERDAVRPDVWRDLLNRYDRLRAKKLSVFADVKDTQCQGCHVSIPGVDLSAHRRGAEVGICKNCGRFLAEVN